MVENGFWVFGYGSLLWQPGFAYSRRDIARLEGYARSFCMRSIHHRGSVKDPGLVLALDQEAGGTCDGLALFVEPDGAAETLAYLRERELISSAYLEATNEIQLRSGEVVPALCYVIDVDHDQYCGGMPLEEQAHIIAQAVGGRGPNTEYLYNTASHLRELQIEDEALNWLEVRVRALVDQGVGQANGLR